jgi:hypothetical protein
MTCDSRGPLPGTPPMGVCVGRAKFKWSCVRRRRCCLVAVVLGSWSGILAGGFPYVSQADLHSSRKTSATDYLDQALSALGVTSLP